MLLNLMPNRPQLIEDVIHDRIHHAEKKSIRLSMVRLFGSINLPIPNHQRRLRHQLSCLVLVLVRVCKLDDLRRSWGHLNEVLRGDERSQSELYVSGSMERFLGANGGTGANIRCLRWSNT